MTMITAENLEENIDDKKIDRFLEAMNDLSELEMNCIFHSMNYAGLVNILNIVSCSIKCQHDINSFQEKH